MFSVGTLIIHIIGNHHCVLLPLYDIEVLHTKLGLHTDHIHAILYIVACFIRLITYLINECPGLAQNSARKKNMLSPQWRK